MKTVKCLITVSTLSAAVAASMAYAQSTFDQHSGVRYGASREDARVFEAMRASEERRRAHETAVISAAELNRARAAGEIKLTPTDTQTVREYSTGKTEPQSVIQAPAQSVPAQPATAQQPRPHSGTTQALSPQPQMVNALTQMSAREATQGTVNARPTGAIVYLPDARNGGRVTITENQRAAEHARYEASKRRRATESASLTAAEFRGRPADSGAQVAGPSRIEIARPDTRVSTSGNGPASVVRDQPTSSAPERVVVVEYPRNEERAARDILSQLR